MTCELEKIAMEKGINLSFVPRYPINSYYERLCAVKNNDEIIIASWSGNTLEVAAGDLKEITANNPDRNIKWVYTVKKSDIPSHLWE